MLTRASGLRVAAVPPREERGAFDPPCAPCRPGGVGTKGVPPEFDPLLAGRTKGNGQVGMRACRHDNTAAWPL